MARELLVASSRPAGAPVVPESHGAETEETEETEAGPAHSPPVESFRLSDPLDRVAKCFRPTRGSSGGRTRSPG